MPVKKEYRSSSSLSCCDSCCNCIGSTGLQILNFLDFSVGLTFIVMGLWMTLELTSEERDNVNVHWITIMSFVLGATICVIAVLSFVAVASADYRKAIIPASYLSLIVTFLALGTGITQLVKRKGFNDYMENEEEAHELSEADADTIRFLYALTAFLNFFEVVSSMIRFGGSRAYYNSSVKIDNDFAETLLRQERDMDEKYDANRSKVYSKYDGLRDHYREKYVTGSTPGDET